MRANGTASDVRFCYRFREKASPPQFGKIILALEKIRSFPQTVAKGCWGCCWWFRTLHVLIWKMYEHDKSFIWFMMSPCSHKWWSFQISLHHQERPTGYHLLRVSLVKRCGCPSPEPSARPILPQRGAFDWSHFGREATERCPLWISEICESGARRKEGTRGTPNKSWQVFQATFDGEIEMVGWWNGFGPFLVLLENYEKISKNRRDGERKPVFGTETPLATFVF